MIIHFICRGNAFRSFLAEAYTRSLQLPDVTVLSSGTIASATKESNANYQRYVQHAIDRHGLRPFAKDEYGDDLTVARLQGSDVVVCMNRRVYDEAVDRLALPAGTIIWDITDVNEKDRQIETEADVPRYVEMAYDEITERVDALVRDLKFV